MIEFLVDRKRTTLAILVVLIFAGIIGRINIPIESEPEITSPVVYAGVVLPGISPSDAERLLLKPLEDEIRGISGIEEMQGFAGEDYAAVIVRFDAVDSMKISIDKIRDAVSDAESKFPEDAKDPVVRELSISDEPIVIITINSDVSGERYLLNLAREIKKDIELIPAVFDAEIVGARDEQLEATINRSQLESYNISYNEILRAVANNNQVVTAGEIETGKGQFSVSLPGLFETARDVYDLPVRSTDNSTIYLSDIAKVKRNFKDRESYSKIDGKKTLSIFVKKSRGENIIETLDQVEEVVNSYKNKISSDININFILDNRNYIAKQVQSLQGNILLATLFVIIITMLALGIRSSLIVGSGIPISILVSLFVLYIAGYDYNFMVIFGILVALGMLIDGSLVVVEFADRKMVEGFKKQEAYVYAAKRMFWPIVASSSNKNFSSLGSEMNFNLEELTGYLGKYVSILNWVIKRPILVLSSIIITLYIIISSYMSFGPGMVFFSQTDPYFGNVKISARGNLSIEEINNLTSEVEEILTETPGIKNIYLQTGRFGGIGSRGGNAEDTIANVFFEFIERKERKNGYEIIDDIRKKTDLISGIKVSVDELQNGPPVGKDIEIRLSGPSTDLLIPFTKELRTFIDENVEGLASIEDTLPIPLVEWQLTIDKPKAAQYGADIFTIGTAVNLVTNGVMLGKYRPDDVDEELEIYVRFPEQDRSIDQLDEITIETNNGAVPISNFVTKKAKKNVSFLRRYDARNVMYIKMNTTEGVTVGEKVSEIESWIKTQEYPSQIDIVFGGENEEQNDSMKFVVQAMIISLLLMAALLVTQFNSFYQSFIILTAVIMSTAGVFTGLLIFNQEFSAILHGIGVISLAGIVVNNNIILIDAFNFIHNKNDMDIKDSILKACAQRLRPIFLTTVTTMLGLIPLALDLSIDPVGRTIDYNSFTTTFWAPLAQCIVYGLSFSAILTLIVTPCLLILPGHVRKIIASRKKRYIFI